jgi:hypothetical protein
MISLELHYPGSVWSIESEPSLDLAKAKAEWWETQGAANPDHSLEGLFLDEGHEHNQSEGFFN